MKSDNPNGVAARRHEPATTPLGLKTLSHSTQGSLRLATLGWWTQSRWDCSRAEFVADSSRLVLPWNSRKTFGLGLCVTLAALSPANGFACAACYGGHLDDRMADGMNWAILTLGVIIATVLGAFLAFLIRVIRKSEALEAAAQAKSPEPSKI